MSLDMILSEGHSLSSLVRGAELVLALGKVGDPQQMRLRIDGSGSTWRHLLSEQSRTQLRQLEATRPDAKGTGRIWIGPHAACPKILLPGTWCIATDLNVDLRQRGIDSIRFAMRLSHPHASGVSQLGASPVGHVPFATNPSMRRASATAPSGVCVVGSGDVAADRAQIALVARRTAGDVVVFDPYQHHQNAKWSHVRRIVAPCGPSRRAMMYASCRFVVSAASSLGFDDHFVYEAVAMGLVPLAAFAPAQMRLEDDWDPHLMAAAFSAARASSRATTPVACAPATPLAQAQSVRTVLHHAPVGRPWGTGGPMGCVQYLRADDVAQVRHADCRALVVICGHGFDNCGVVDAWLARCDYRAVCVAGSNTTATAHALAQAGAHQNLFEAQSAGEVLGVCALLRQNTPQLQFDIVHLGDSAANILEIRALIALFDSAPGARACALALIVCPREGRMPQWIRAWQLVQPQTLIVRLGLGDAADHDALAWSGCKALLGLAHIVHVIDAGGGGPRLAAAAQLAGRPPPHTWADAPWLASQSLDTARYMHLHQGACRAALSWPVSPCIVLVSAPKPQASVQAALAPVWQAVHQLRQQGHLIHVCVLVPEAPLADILALEASIDCLALQMYITLCAAPNDVYAPDFMSWGGEDLYPRAVFGAADVYLDGPWAGASSVVQRQSAMAAGLPIVAWQSAHTDFDGAHLGEGVFSIEQDEPSAMCAALLAYLRALLIDAPLRVRMGLRAQASVQATHDVLMRAATMRDAVLRKENAVPAKRNPAHAVIAPARAARHTAHKDCVSL